MRLTAVSKPTGEESMRMKYWTVLTLALFCGNVRGEYAVEWFEKYQQWSIESVTVTSSGLNIRFKNPWFLVFLDWDKKEWDKNMYRSSADYIKNNEALILTPDNKTVCLGQQHTQVHFTPVSYRNGLAGFRITDMFTGAPYGLRTNNVLYVALSDSPIEVGEEDVEMVKDKGEWIKFEREGEVQDTPPSREKTVVATQDETPANVAEDEPSEEETNANNLWLYALIPLCLLALLWLVRKKRKRNTEN